MNFVNLADSEGIDLTGGWIVQWTNLSFDFFGMVRGNIGRDGARNRDGRYIPGPRNWHHHVVLDFDGWIFDFDFTNSPQAVRTNTYVSMMFAQQGELPNYEAEITSTLDYLRLRADHSSQIGQPMKVLLKNYLLDHWR